MALQTIRFGSFAGVKQGACAGGIPLNWAEDAQNVSTVGGRLRRVSGYRAVYPTVTGAARKLRRLFYYGSNRGTLRFPGMGDGTVEITYRYQPALLTELTDEPQLPEGFQGMMAEYAAARERSRFDAASQNAARMDLTLYRELKGKLKRGYPAPDLSRIYRIY